MVLVSVTKQAFQLSELPDVVERPLGRLWVSGHPVVVHTFLVRRISQCLSTRLLDLQRQSGLKARLHVPSPSPCPSSFYIMPMETGRLMGRMGSVPILQDDGPFPLA